MCFNETVLMLRCFILHDIAVLYATDTGSMDINIDYLYIYHYTNLTFICLSVCDVRAGGHGKPFDPS